VTIANAVCVRPSHADQVCRTLGVTLSDTVPAEIDFDEDGKECCTDCK
jgi:hypothetical protein